MGNHLTAIRALEMFDHVPPGHILHLQRSDMHAPHLRAGELAVVDATDRAIAWGELFLITQNTRRIIWQIMPETDAQRARRADPDDACVWFRPLDNPLSAEDIHERARSGRRIYCSDGPYPVRLLEREIIGRVVGIFE